MLLWIILKKQNILKGRFHIEEEYCGIHYQTEINASESKAVLKESWPADKQTIE